MKSSLTGRNWAAAFQPQSCIICQQNSYDLICGYCKQDLPLFNLQLCNHNLLQWPAIKSGLAGVDFSTLLALTDYCWPLNKLLTGLKFSAKLPHAKALAELFFQHCLATNQPMPQAILPVPLHQQRFAQRKYNQSIEIARQIGLLTGIPIDLSILTRCKATTPQTQLSAAQRKRNLRQAFSLNDPVTHQHIALFDDVLTTGATMQSLYRLLRNSYPLLRIDIWSICVTLDRPQSPP